MIQVVELAGRAELARVFVVRLRESQTSLVECVGAVDPALPRTEKMVIVVSTQLGCPVGCPMCDAGTAYDGNLTAREIIAQIELVLEQWAAPEAGSCRKLKVQFARMGEPAFNPAVLDAIEWLGKESGLPGCMPCVATTAPAGAEAWLERLVTMRDRWFGDGRFQIQLSVQSTSEAQRDRMIPVRKLTMPQLAAFARKTTRATDRKVTLNFAMADGVELSPARLAEVFDPEVCLVKLTPLNPTAQSRLNGLSTVFDAGHRDRVDDLVADIRSRGFDCVVSTGLAEEVELSTSCGQLARIRRAPVRGNGAVDDKWDRGEAR